MNSPRKTGLQWFRDPDFAVLALIAMAMPAEVNVVGRLTFSDMFCAALAPFMVATRFRYLRDKTTRTFLALGVVWFCGAVLTDFIRSTPSDDLARGWAKIIFFLINFVTVRCLIGNSQYKGVFFVFLCAVAATLKLALGVGGVDFGGEVLGTAWRFGYGFLFAQCCFLFAAFLERRAIYPTVSKYLPFAAGFVALMSAARNLFAITLLAAMTNLFRTNARSATKGALFVYAVAGLLVLYGGVAVYKYSAASGALGEDARVKYEAQASNSLGLLAGRAEFLSSSKAIMDSPIIGHGSWARDTRYIDYMVERLRDAGVVIEGDTYASDLIPTHSHIFGAWVEAGLAGAIFWIYVLYLTIAGLIRVNRFPSLLTGFISLILIQLLWDIFFSPFGLDRRLVNSAWICLIIAVLNERHAVRPANAVNRPPLSPGAPRLAAE